MVICRRDIRNDCGDTMKILDSRFHHGINGFDRQTGCQFFPEKFFEPFQHWEIRFNRRLFHLSWRIAAVSREFDTISYPNIELNL